MDKKLTAEILCVGTELLLGDIINTNGPAVAKALASLGINLYRETTVGDNAQRLKNAVKNALCDSDILITVGGLGPTYDDLTKETVAEYFSLPLVTDEESLLSLESFFKERGRKMTENNKKQALLPRGAEALKNKFGTAPGVYLEQGNKTVIMLPGPPRELIPMLKDEVVPRLRKKAGKGVFVSRSLRVFGIGESKVEEILRDLMDSKNPTLAPYAKTGEVQLRITASAADENTARKLIAPMEAALEKRLGDAVYGRDTESLEEELVRLLTEKNLKITTAESCTGGMISERITSIPGASKVFEVGIASYSDRIKHEILGVNEQTLAEKSAVSDACALEMARGARLLSGADIALSVTGYASGGEGVPEGKTGLVYIGVSTKEKAYVTEFMLGTHDRSRNDVRFLAASHAMFLAIKEIREMR